MVAEGVATGEKEEAEGEPGVVAEAEKDVGELDGREAGRVVDGLEESPAALGAELPQNGKGRRDDGLVIGRKKW